MHKKYPQAPLFAIGNSIGANILVLADNLLTSLASCGYYEHVS